MGNGITPYLLMHRKNHFMQPEIDWGNEKVKPDRGRISELERELIAKRIRNEEIAMAAKRFRRMRRAILLPLCLAVIVVGVLAALDYGNIIHVGWFTRFHANRIDALTASDDPNFIIHHPPVLNGPLKILEPAKPIQAPPKVDPAVVETDPQPVPVAAPPAMPIDPVQVERAKTHMDRALRGVKMISDELNEVQASLVQGDQNLASYRSQLAAAQNNLQSAYSFYNSSHTLQTLNSYNACSQAVENLQISVHNQITANDEASGHVKTLSDRLEKAKKELVDSYVHYVQVGGTPQQ
jgi:hypothetical protein